MIRTFKYRLHPNAEQAHAFDAWRQQCCDLYNAALEERNSHWQRRRTIERAVEALGQKLSDDEKKRWKISYITQCHQLTALRQEDPFWRGTPALAQRSALRRVERAFTAFFARCKRGEKPGHPRFRAKRRYDSFEIGRVSVKKDRVHIPKLGHVKMNLYRPIGGEIRNAAIHREATGKWWISFQCNVGDAPAKTPVGAITSERMVGIDLGLSELVTLSTGATIENPRYARGAAAQLARRQRKLASKQKCSKNRERKRILVAKAHAHVAHQRLDYAHQEAKRLLDRFDVIFYEDLNLRGLCRGWLSKSFADAAWGIFLRHLISKAEEAGKHVVPVDARLSSQLCSACGQLVEKTLSERIHRCVCGLTLGRDHNAALNVLARGRRALELTVEVGVEREAFVQGKAQHDMGPGESSVFLTAATVVEKIECKKIDLSDRTR